MKYSYIITILLISINSITLLGQINGFSFENNDTLYSKYIQFDTVNNPNNIWEVGTPMKSLFDSSYYSKRALITDSMSTYPINDTSVFYISLPEKYDYIVYLSFSYKMDSDTLKDFGKIEISPDSGNTWIDVLEERSTYNFIVNFNSFQQKDFFTGRTNEWHDFTLWIPEWDNTFNNSDSGIFRFSFISDSIETNQEGWMIDDLEVGWDFYKSVSENNQLREVNVYPNPAQSLININQIGNQQDFMFNLYDMLGEKVLTKKLHPYENTVNVSQLTSGIYTYKMGATWGKIVVE